MGGAGDERGEDPKPTMMPISRAVYMGRRMMSPNSSRPSDPFSMSLRYPPRPAMCPKNENSRKIVYETRKIHSPTSCLRIVAFIAVIMSAAPGSP